MSDVHEDEVVEEEVVVAGDEEEVEFVDPSSAEPAPDDEDVEDEFKGLSKKEIIEKMKAASAPKGPSLEESFDKLTRALAPREDVPPPTPPPSLRLSAEEKKRLKEELYTADDPGELLESMFSAKFESYSNDLVGRVSAKFAEQEGELLKVSSPEYKEFESEIKEVLATLTPAQRAQPGVHKWALEQAKLKNLDKIVERRVEEALAKALPEKGRTVPPRQASGGGTSAPASSKPRVFVDKDVWEREVAKASARGMGPGSSMWGVTKEALVAKYSKPRREKVEL